MDHVYIEFLECDNDGIIKLITESYRNNMYSRRDFLKTALAAAFFASKAPALAAATQANAFHGASVFQRLIDKARTNNWAPLPIGELMGRIAHELLNTPYVANTLELELDREVCTVNLNGLDCVTFFETTLDMARMLKKGKSKAEDLIAEVDFTRYRGGKRGDYSTRLHYTSDWLYDNQDKHVVRILDELPGTEPFPLHVGFMTEHPDKYPQLAKHPELVKEMQAVESRINSRAMKYVPMKNLAAVEHELRTGDIVGICTNIPGLDITHTGLIVSDAEGVPRFANASSAKDVMKVVVNPKSLTEALSRSEHNVGAIFARPLWP